MGNCLSFGFQSIINLLALDLEVPPKWQKSYGCCFSKGRGTKGEGLVNNLLWYEAAGTL